MANTVNPGIDEEELRRQAEEAQRLAEEKAAEAQANAQAEAQKAEENARAANEAAQQAAARTEEAAKKAQEQGFNRTVQEKIHGVEVELLEAGDIQSPALSSELEEYLNKKNRRGELGYGTSWGATNEVAPDYSTIKDNEQAVFLGTLVDPADRMEYFEQYAKQSGQNLEDVLAYADERLGAKIFATPQSQIGKIKAYNQGLANQGLMDVDGNLLDMNTATQAQIEQALRLLPDQAAHKDALAYYSKLCEARGWTYDKDSLGFMDSADLTQKDYNDAVDEYNKLFTIGYTPENEAAYLEELAYIQQQGYKPRIQKQMEAALKKSYEERSGKIAPSSDEIRVAIEQEAADSDDIANESGLLDFLRGMGSAIENQIVHDLFKNKGDVEEQTPDPLLAEKAETEETPVQSGSGSSIASGGMVTVGGMNLPISEPIASAGGMPPASELFENVDVDAITSPTMRALVEEQQASQPEPQEPADQKRYSRDIAYDPNMTDEQALSLYMGGGSLDARNLAQIDRFINDPAAMGLVYGMNGPDASRAYAAQGIGVAAPGTGGYAAASGATLPSYNAVDKFSRYGKSIGAAANILNSGSLPEGIRESALLDLMSVEQEIRSRVSDPRNGISIPNGQNMYDYVLSLDEGLANRVAAVSGAQKQVNEICAENALAEKQAHQTDIENWKAAILAGNGTSEMLAAIAAETDNTYIDISEDEMYWTYKAQLRETGMFFSDGGKFWQGDSAAAQEGNNLRAMGKGGYGEYKSELKAETERVLEEYTMAAARMGMTLEDYLGSAGIDSLDQVIGIAYNNMQAVGNAYANDPEAQQAAYTVAEQTQSVGGFDAAVMGAEHGVKSYGESFFQTSYMMLDAATYAQTVADLQDQYRAEYGAEAPQMYYNDLMAYIESGALSQESAAEMLANMNSARNIFDVGYEIDPGFLKGLLRTGREELGKDVEALEVIAQSLPENERRWFNGLSGVTYSLTGMGVSTLTGGIGRSALLGSAVGWGMPEFASSFEENRAKGMSPGMAGKMAFASATATTLLNMGGTGSQIDTYFGDTAYAGMKSAFSSKGGIGLVKQMAKHLASQAHQEGMEEVSETFVGYGFDLLDDAALAYDRGENPKLSMMFDSVMRNLYETDVASLGKEVLSSYGMGVAYGGIFSLGGVAKSGLSAARGVKMQRNYASIDTATKMIEGDIPFTDDNVGKVYAQLQKDLQDPKFRRWIDSAQRAAREQNNMLTAAMLGAGTESRKSAVAEAERAADYKEKAAAAKSAAETATNRWVELRQQVMNGDLSAVPMMTTAQQQMGKAHTAHLEASNAAQKSEAKAAEKMKEWLAACGTYKSQFMQFSANRASVARNQREGAIDQREQNNVTAIEAESFMDERYPDADDETRSAIMESPAWQEHIEEAPATEEQGAETDIEITRAARNAVNLAARISRRFGVAIDFVDGIEGGALGKYEKGRIILDKKSATQGEVIKRTMVHELTHKAEGSKWYTELRDALLEIAYKGDNERLSADIMSKMKSYNDHASRIGSEKIYTEAEVEQEIVADLAGELFTGSEETINALVAEKPSLMRRVYETVRDFVRKLRGVTDPTLEKIRRAEKIMRKALDTAKDSDGTQKYEIIQDESNWPIVKADRDFVLSDNQKEWSKQIRQYIRDEIRKHGQLRIKTLDGDEVILDKNSQEKARDWMSNGSDDENRVRKNASAHLDEVVAVSEDVDPDGPNKPDEKGQHLWAKDGWRYREAIFEDYDGKRYLLTLSVGMEGDNRTVYNIGDVEEIKKKDSAPVSGQPGRVPSDRAETDESPAIRRLDPSETIISENAPVGNRKYSLPSPEVLNQEISAYRSSRSIAPQTSVQRQNDASERVEMNGQGERQFATQTAQHSEAMPQWLKNELMNDPNQRYYDRDTNDAQLMRAWDRYQQEGYEGVRDRLLAADHFTADDVADANMIMAMAFRNEDVGTALSIAQKYNEEGTKQGQALQARQVFKRMSPTGIRQWAAGEAERNLAEHIQTHTRQKRDVDAAARRVADKIRDMQGGEEALRLASAGTYTVDSTNNKWGVPINEQQRALIEQYNLEGVARPGLFYNRATRKQRMLEAILATPNPLEVTGNGLNLIQRLEYMQEGAAVITNADLNYIGQQLAQFAAMDADAQQEREGDLALARAYEAYGNITPSTFEEKARTWRYTSMLLSVPSALRNVIGNAAQNTVNSTAHGIAVELDRIAAAVTGRQRTMSHLSLKEHVEGWNAFAEETANTFRDFFIDKAITSNMRGDDRHNTNQRGRVYETGVLETARLAEGYLMSVGDRNFWKRAYVNSIAEQQRVAERNGVPLDYEQAAEIARAEANYATFNEDSSVRNVFSQLKNNPNPIIRHVVDFIMPFTGVPTNITKRMIQYSPAGLLGTIVTRAYNMATKTDFDARAFYTELSRGLTGTALFGIGMLMKEAGLIMLGTGDEDDTKVYGVRTAQGGQYSPYIRVGDEYVSLAAFAPAVSPLIMGATAIDLFKEDEDKLSAIYNACLAGLDQIFDASYMSSLQDIFKGYGSTAENIGTSVLNSAVSQNVPALFGQMATAMDPYVRDTKDKSAIMQALKTGLISKIPGLREMLPEKVDVAGKSVISKEGLRNFFDPFTTTNAADDPALDELMRLYEATGDSSFMPVDALSGTKNTLTVKKEKIVVDGKDKEAYKKRYGELWHSEMERLMNMQGYARMSDEKKIEKIKKIVADAKKKAAEEIAREIKARK